MLYCQFLLKYDTTGQTEKEQEQREDHLPVGLDAADNLAVEVGSEGAGQQLLDHLLHLDTYSGAVVFLLLFTM